jgi:hypothetical protein
MNTQTIELTAEKFAEIYSNEELRNQVAFAHEQCDKSGNFLRRITCSYPLTYIVNDEQIAAANAERLRAKKQVIQDNLGKLMFVGMGNTYEEKYPDDVCNYRVRTEFINPDGNKFFIEFTGINGKMHIDHAIDRTKETKLNGDFKRQSEYYNYKGLERNNNELAYTKSNILEVVNKYFECNFKEIVIDNYNVSTEDFISISPQ